MGYQFMASGARTDMAQAAYTDYRFAGQREVDTMGLCDYGDLTGFM